MTMKCDYCGKEEKKTQFWIGAAPTPKPGDPLYGETEFTMHEGTGKLSCANCRPKGDAEALAVINKLKSS